jgi:hypothetical protein
MVRSLVRCVRRGVGNHFVILVLAALAIVAQISAAARPIIDGVIDEANSYSNVCAILGPSASDHSKIIVGASGTLIHPKVVLTAGHVTRDIEGALAAGMPLEALRVTFSSNAFDQRSWRGVSAVITHPGYFLNNSNGIPDNDIGILILQERVKGITPVTLAPVGLLDSLVASGQLHEGNQGRAFTIVGYGDDRTFPHPEPIERDGLRRFAECEFAALSDRWLMLSQNPGSDGGGGNNGDSGGPAFLVDPATGRIIQAALISWSGGSRVGTENCYRLDLPESRTFIDSVIASLDN